MDKDEYLRRRRSKYMAQTLEALEETVIITMNVPADSAAAYRAARDRPFDGPTGPDKEAFQRYVEPHLPAGAVKAIRDFKGLLRARFNALSTDAIDLMSLGDVEFNGFAVDIRDRLSPTGRP